MDIIDHTIEKRNDISNNMDLGHQTWTDFENEMEQPYRIINTNRMKFTGQTLDLLDTDQMKFID